MLKPFIALSIETITNQALKLDPEREYLLSALQGKTLAIEMSDWRLHFCFVPEAQRLRVYSQEQAAADATLYGKLIDLLRLGLSQHPQAILAKGDVKIEGDMDVLHAYQTFMQRLDLDWEGLLGKYLGLGLSHEIAKPIKRFVAWQKSNAKSTCQDLSEYLQEEFRLLPPREEVEDFYADIQRLRADIERLDAMIKSLRK